jgi:hypothetical protein
VPAKTLDLCVADGWRTRQMGYAKVTHMLEIFGVCPEPGCAGNLSSSQAPAMNTEFTNTRITRI